MDHLYRDLAPISEAAWSQVEGEAKSRLVPHLAARKLVDVDGPSGWGYSATDLGRVEEVESPSEGVRALRRRVLPVVELRAEFAVSREELDDADRGAGDIELRELDEAVRQIALAENTAVFQGYVAGGILGITEESSHSPIAIDADKRGRGLSRNLLLTHLGHLAGRGVRRIFLEVEENNAPARRLYERCGFAVVGRRERYYRQANGEQLNALLMRRDLS